MNDNYAQGFIDKCAEANVDVKDLVKFAGGWGNFVAGAGRMLAKPYAGVAKFLGAEQHAKGVTQAAEDFSKIQQHNKLQALLKKHAPNFAAGPTAQNIDFNRIPGNAIEAGMRLPGGASDINVPWEELPSNIRHGLIQGTPGPQSMAFGGAMPDEAAAVKGLRAPGYTALGLGSATAAGGGLYGYKKHEENEYAQKHPLLWKLHQMMQD